jgi:hypothetical protein
MKSYHCSSKDSYASGLLKIEASDGANKSRQLEWVLFSRPYKNCLESAVHQTVFNLGKDSVQGIEQCKLQVVACIDHLMSSIPTLC